MPRPEREPERSDVEAIQVLAEARGRILGEMRKVIVGQDRVIDELMMAILADGHSILIGVPGLAKTLMVSTLASSLHTWAARSLNPFVECLRALQTPVARASP